MTKALIGLEIHAELMTQTKMFCGCKNEFGATPNTNVCPVCLGHPGTLPRINKGAVEKAVLAGLAMNCQIRKECQMDSAHIQKQSVGGMGVKVIGDVVMKLLHPVN